VISTPIDRGLVTISREELHTPTYTADEYQILAGKIHELEVEREELRAIARRLDNLDAAELLNFIRKQNPKSKTSLRDIEAILAAIGGTIS